MAVAATSYEHIAIDENGVPQIVGANTKVVEVVVHMRASGISAEQLAVELPHLTPAQIHSAMAYYWDHKDELDADVARRREYAERMRREMGQPPIVGKLRQQGLI
ncbi:MAG: DUF433 domain-containing protein [Acidobacteria bacterium]|nr:MAG: DUF433 domain-containing protein [Acidobacteriota bacterium]